MPLLTASLHLPQCSDRWRHYWCASQMIHSALLEEGIGAWDVVLCNRHSKQISFT